MDRIRLKYPFWTVTGQVVIGFPFFYVVAFFAAASSYGPLFQMPADQSRSFSHLYYGAIVSLLPYLALGFLLGALVQAYGGRAKTFWLTVHVVVLAFALEKGAGLYLASLIADSGFPASFYGRGYPSSGMRLLCEELPYYCPPYANLYGIGGTVVGAASFAAGAYAGKRLSARSAA
ncbi:hypothetical protein [Paenibacillus sp. GYB003]|uniref:hypothetical protein n=1 Tax=Paenibacillus sp. GYB003 TaxID=2994392 RepID=UPI002F960FF2